ncbi:MAG: SH3 domain-containing protein [Caldilineaceae bacterium]
MQRVILAILFGLATSLTLAAVALAEEYVVSVIVDGKEVKLSVVVDGNSLIVDPESPGVVVASITEVATPVQASKAAANRNANLRGGPGTNFPVVGSVRTGQALAITGRNPAGDWLQLADGKWIAAFLVTNAPADLSVTGAPTVAAQTVAPTVTSIPPTPLPAPTPTPTPTPAPTVGSNCDPSYPDVCIPSPPPDLDCGEIPYRRFRVVGADPHRFDGDHDGIGCER